MSHEVASFYLIAGFNGSGYRRGQTKIALGDETVRWFFEVKIRIMIAKRNRLLTNDSRGQREVGSITLALTPLSRHAGERTVFNFHRFFLTVTSWEVRSKPKGAERSGAFKAEGGLLVERSSLGGVDGLYRDTAIALAIHLKSGKIHEIFDSFISESYSDYRPSDGAGLGRFLEFRSIFCPIDLLST